MRWVGDDDIRLWNLVRHLLHDDLSRHLHAFALKLRIAFHRSPFVLDLLLGHFVLLHVLPALEDVVDDREHEQDHDQDERDHHNHPQDRGCRHQCGEHRKRGDGVDLRADHEDRHDDQEREFERVDDRFGESLFAVDPLDSTDRGQLAELGHDRIGADQEPDLHELRRVRDDHHNQQHREHDTEDLVHREHGCCFDRSRGELVNTDIAIQHRAEDSLKHFTDHRREHHERNNTS